MDSPHSISWKKLEICTKIIRRGFTKGKKLGSEEAAGVDNEALPFLSFSWESVECLTREGGVGWAGEFAFYEKNKSIAHNYSGNQPWIFIEDWCWSSNTLATWCEGPDAGKDWRGQEKGWQRMRRFNSIINSNGHGFEQTSGESGGQGSLTRCCSRGHKDSDTTLQLNNKIKYICLQSNFSFICCWNKTSEMQFKCWSLLS